MADDKVAGRSNERPAEPAKPEVNRVAELVRPVTHPPGHEAGHAVESPSLADLLGIAPPSPGHADHASMQVAEREKTWAEKIREERGQAGSNGSGGDQNWAERARILPVEQKEEQEIERER